MNISDFDKKMRSCNITDNFNKADNLQIILTRLSSNFSISLIRFCFSQCHSLCEPFDQTRINQIYLLFKQQHNTQKTSMVVTSKFSSNNTIFVINNHSFQRIKTCFIHGKITMSNISCLAVYKTVMKQVFRYINNNKIIHLIKLLYSSIHCSTIR